MEDDLFKVRCAKCGKVGCACKNRPVIRGWEFINSRLVCADCVKIYNNKKGKKV